MSRFLRLCWTFAVASALATSLFLLEGWILDAVWPQEGGDLAPLIEMLRAGKVWFFSLPIGLFVVAFRRHMVQARPPFLRWGCLPLAMAPAVPMGLEGRWDLALLLDAELQLLVTLLIFAWLARRILGLAAAE